MIKRVLPSAIILAALAATAYTLTLLDQVVNDTLYDYGLDFSYNWANPYWALLRTTLALLAIAAITTSISTILTIRRNLKTKQPSVKIAPTRKVMKSIPVTTRTIERAPITPPVSSLQSTKPPTNPTPITAPATSYSGSEVLGLFKCVHCGKMFTQPLRMLDFQIDPPRIVNVCPFCNETMPSAPKVKEAEQNEDKPFFKRINNNHAQKPWPQ